MRYHQETEVYDLLELGHSSSSYIQSILLSPITAIEHKRSVVRSLLQRAEPHSPHTAAKVEEEIKVMEARRKKGYPLYSSNYV